MARLNKFTGNPTDSDGWELGFEEWLSDLWCDPTYVLEDIAQAEFNDTYENGTPEERHLIQYELHLLSNE